MKNRLLLWLVFFILGNLQHSFAAFPVKNTSENVKATNIKDRKIAPVVTKRYNKIVDFTDHVTKVLHIPNPIHPERRSGNTLGILSLVFGILSIVMVSYLAGFYFGIPAIILGAMGLSRGDMFSLAGLILGCVGLLLSILVLLFVAAFLGFLIF